MLTPVDFVADGSFWIVVLIMSVIAHRLYKLRVFLNGGDTGQSTFVVSRRSFTLIIGLLSVMLISVSSSVIDMYNKIPAVRPQFKRSASYSTGVVFGAIALLFVSSWGYLRALYDARRSLRGL